VNRLPSRYWKLTLDEYQDAAARTAAPLDKSKYPKMLRGLLGLVGETGELSEHIKKALFQGHEMDEQKVLEEMGDVLWYLAVGADDMGYSLSYIATQNIGKLRERYPDGFDPERSQSK
jgi:NTP pyrophosphatase (non-canonical NTP hydrolase)